MRLDRNLEGHPGKYAIVNVRKLTGFKPDGTGYSQECNAAIQLLFDEGLLEYSTPGSKEEFFVVKLKDVNSPPALIAYAGSAMLTDPEYARDVREMAARAGPAHKHCKDPD